MSQFSSNIVDSVRKSFRREPPDLRKLGIVSQSQSTLVPAVIFFQGKIRVEGPLREKDLLKFLEKLSIILAHSTCHGNNDWMNLAMYLTPTICDTITKNVSCRWDRKAHRLVTAQSKFRFSGVTIRGVVPCVASPWGSEIKNGISMETEGGDVLVVSFEFQIQAKLISHWERTSYLDHGYSLINHKLKRVPKSILDSVRSQEQNSSFLITDSAKSLLKDMKAIDSGRTAFSSKPSIEWTSMNGERS